MRLLLISLLLVTASLTAQEGVKFEGNKMILSEVPPTWPGCTGDVDEKNKCFRKKLGQHLKNNFKYPLSYKAGNAKEKVVMTFMVDINGKPVIKNVVGGTVALQDEAIRTILSIPQLTPAKMAGKAREMKFTVPFTL